VDKVRWQYFKVNPCMFVYDYKRMKHARSALVEELMRERFHPKNIHKFEEWGF